MNIGEQCVSLELAKRLKELGAKQDSLFYRFDHESHQYLFCKYYEQYSPHVDLDINEGYSAFTVAELGEMLPSFFIDKEFEETYFYSQGRGSLGYKNHYISYNKPIKDRFSICIEDDSEANARAKMLIFLYEQGIIIENLKNE